VGPALLVERAHVPVFRLLLPSHEVDSEVRRLEEALDTSRRQLLAIKERLGREVGVPHAYIFDAHLLMLEDPLLRGRAVAVVRDERVNAEWALRLVSQQLHDVFDEFKDDYLRERSTDLDDVLGRVQLNLVGGRDAPSLARLPGRFVMVASDLGPSEAAELDWGRVLGIALDAGSPTYHTAILARSFGVPAVVGLQEATRAVAPGALLVIDGSRGVVLVEPPPEVAEGYRREAERGRRAAAGHAAVPVSPAVTADGVRLSLQANVEFPDEAATARRYGAEGIGLFRSEYLLARAREWPGEERQVEIYRRLLEESAPHPVTVRTWDIGVEDIAPGGPSSPNPALGQRAGRLLERAPEPFRVQLRALLRAAAHGRLRVMFPFVGGPADLARSLAFLGRVRDELAGEDLLHAARVEVGVNVELPSAALTADHLARHVDFFSIGTNDLIQYVLAVDRADPRVMPLYEPFHPAVLRLVDRVVRAARQAGIPVSVCGEMAGQALSAVALVGLGVRELSMSPASIPGVRRALPTASAARARAVMERCLDLPTAAEVEREIDEALGRGLREAERSAAGVPPAGE
jgi:phosphotransferase system enzyme I (PtsI)